MDRLPAFVAGNMSCEGSEVFGGSERPKRGIRERVLRAAPQKGKHARRQ